MPASAGVLACYGFLILLPASRGQVGDWRLGEEFRIDIMTYIFRMEP
jgi:hypothetical protein